MPSPTEVGTSSQTAAQQKRRASAASVKQNMSPAMLEATRFLMQTMNDLSNTLVNLAARANRVASAFLDAFADKLGSVEYAKLSLIADFAKKIAPLPTAELIKTNMNSIAANIVQYAKALANAANYVKVETQLE